MIKNNQNVEQLFEELLEESPSIVKNKSHEKLEDKIHQLGKISKDTIGSIFNSLMKDHSEELKDNGIFVGKIFGKRTVMSDIPITRMQGMRNYIFYKCKCFCGQVKYIRYYDLIYGTGTQCIRCSQEELIYFIGQVVGNKTIIDIKFTEIKSKLRKGFRKIVKYRCICGDERLSRPWNFMRTKQCNICATIENGEAVASTRLNEIIGQWKILELCPHKKNKQRYYIVQCTCGYKCKQRYNRIKNKKCPVCQFGQGMRYIGL